MYKIDYQISGNTPNFNVSLRKGTNVITNQVLTQSGTTSTFSNLDYDVLDYNLYVTDQINNTSQYDFDTLRPLNIGDFNSTVRVIKLLPNGKYILGGKFSSYTFSGVTTQSQRIVIINSDGSVFKAFEHGFTGGYNTVPTIVETGATENDTNYTIITDIFVDDVNNMLTICGNYTQYNDVEYRGIIKIDFNGVVNTTFSVSGPNGGIGGTPVVGTYITPQFIVEYDNDYIMLGGQIKTYRTTNIKHICKINKTTGSINNTFMPLFTPTVSYRCSCAYNGNVYAGGEFIASYGGMNHYQLISLNGTDGSVNLDFVGTGTSHGLTASEGTQSIYSIVVSSGKILIGGNFSDYLRNGTDTIAKKIIRLNLDGTIDSTFNNGGGSTKGINHDTDYWLVRYLYVDSNNKIYVCGQFNNYNENTNVLSLIRINEDGSLDSTYLGNEICFGGTVPITVQTILSAGQNKILVGGTFTQYTDPVDSTVDLSNNIILLYDNGTLIN